MFIAKEENLVHRNQMVAQKPVVSQRGVDWGPDHSGMSEAMVTSLQSQGKKSGETSGKGIQRSSENTLLGLFSN